MTDAKEQFSSQREFEANAERFLSQQLGIGKWDDLEPIWKE